MAAQSKAATVTGWILQVWMRSVLMNAAGVYQMSHRLARILDLLAKESWRRIYAGELEVRPAFALCPREGCPPKRVARRRTSESFGRQATRCAHHRVTWRGL